MIAEFALATQPKSVLWSSFAWFKGDCLEFSRAAELNDLKFGLRSPLLSAFANSRLHFFGNTGGRLAGFRMNKEQKETTQGSILIVDDTLANLDLLTRMLTRKGYTVRAVDAGRKALAIAQAELPDLILLDVCMSDMDGYTVCQALKANAQTQEIPVIFISALNEVGNKIRAFDVGGVDYITKPFRIAEVIARVTTHITIRQLQRALQRQNDRLQQEVRDRQAAEMALQMAIHELERLANLDGLTQLANRRRFDEYLAVEWRRLTREGLPLSLILCDVDFFKRYNDSYGHQAGDQCLCAIAKVLRQTIKRPADLVARYGGEEFAVILPNTPLAGACQVGETIQQRVLALSIPHASSEISPYITVSFGVASVIPVLTLLPDQLVAVADQALYRAKSQGRNQVVAEIMSTAE